MPLQENELVNVRNVLAGPVKADFNLSRDWFVLNCFVDEEDSTVTFPYQGRIEISLYRRIASGLLGRRERVGSCTLVSGESRQIFVAGADQSFFGAWQLEINAFDWDGYTDYVPVVIQSIGSMEKESDATATGQFYTEKMRSIAFWVVYDAPVTSDQTFTVTEYARTLGTPDTSGNVIVWDSAATSVPVGEIEVTVPTGEKYGKIVVDPACGWAYGAAATGDAHKIYKGGIPIR
jgi:hypothetical protein